MLKVLPKGAGLGLFCAKISLLMILSGVLILGITEADVFAVKLARQPVAGKKRSSPAGYEKSSKKPMAKETRSKKAIIPQKSRSARDWHKSIKRLWDFQTPDLKNIPKFWEPVTGHWILSFEPEHPGNHVLRQTAVKRASQCLLSKSQLVNFEFSAKLRADSFERKTRNWQMGLIFRWKDPDYYYKFRITAANVALLRCSPKSEEVLPGCKGSSRAASATGRFGKKDESILLILPMTNPSDQWHTLSASCYGERITIKLNGREIRMLTDSVIGSGKVGVFTYKTQVFVDDMRLFYLPVPDVKTGIFTTQEVFSLKKNPQLLIYYRNYQSGFMKVNVLGPDRKLFQVLTKGLHSAGLGSVTWDGQSFDGKLPVAGKYILELDADGKSASTIVRVKP